MCCYGQQASHMTLPILAKLREAVGVVGIAGVPLIGRGWPGPGSARTLQAGAEHVVLATLGDGLAQAIVPQQEHLA